MYWLIAKGFFCSNKEQRRNIPKNIEMNKNNYYATGNFLDYEYFSNHYKLIAIDLSKQVEFDNPNLNEFYW